jgi:hypothetical protein
MVTRYPTMTSDGKCRARPRLAVNGLRCWSVSAMASTAKSRGVGEAQDGRGHQLQQLQRFSLLMAPVYTNCVLSTNTLAPNIRAEPSP